MRRATRVFVCSRLARKPASRTDPGPPDSSPRNVDQTAGDVKANKQGTRAPDAIESLRNERRIHVHRSRGDWQRAMRGVQDVSDCAHATATAGSGTATTTHLSHRARALGGMAENLTIADLVTVADEHGFPVACRGARARSGGGPAPSGLPRSSILKTTFNIVPTNHVRFWITGGNHVKNAQVLGPASGISALSFQQVDKCSESQPTGLGLSSRGRREARRSIGRTTQNEG